MCVVYFRLYPSVPIFGRTLQDDFNIDNKVIPQGTTVMVFAYLLHRNPHVWDEPLKYRPERFLSGCSNEEDRHPFSYVPFSAGARNCIGQRFAMMEEKTIMSKLFRKIRIQKVSSVEDVPPIIEVITRPCGEMNAKFVPLA